MTSQPGPASSLMTAGRRSALPGADGHLVRVVDEGAAGAAVAAAEAVVVHAVLLLLLLLPGVSDDGDAPLDRSAASGETTINHRCTQ